MIIECRTCEYRNTCQYKRKYPNTMVCTDFGGVDENGNLVEEIEENKENDNDR